MQHLNSIGKYKIINILGKGAMGIVYKALDPDINREVAIKIIRFDLVSEETEKENLMKRFIIEARAAGKLTHPNIITIYDVGREKDVTYIVMQYVEGQSLKSLMSLKKDFTSGEIVWFISQICSGLDYAHKHGIVHRDIKPGNILIDNNGKPYVADFGVAQIESTTIMKTEAGMGTPSYMSPEQVKGKKIDKRSDLFSLGVIMYELFTGEKPFNSLNVTTVIYKILHENPKFPTKANNKVPSIFTQIIKKALEKDPKNRYQSCRQLKADLMETEELMERTLPVGLDVGKILKQKKKRKSKWRFVTAFLILCIIAGGGGAFIFWQHSKKTSSRVSKKNQIIKPYKTKTDIQIEAKAPEKIKAKQDEIAGKLKTMILSYEEKDFTETEKIAAEILSQDPENKQAREFLSKAASRITQAKISRLKTNGIDHYKNKRYQQCIRVMGEILKLDKGDKEAIRYVYLAETSISREKIHLIIERHQTAEREKDLLLLLNDVSPPALIEEIKEEATRLFNNYDEISSVISDIKIGFKTRELVIVSFAHLMIGVSKNTGGKKVLFDGVKNWNMEKTRSGWKIIKIN